MAEFDLKLSDFYINKEDIITEYPWSVITYKPNHTNFSVMKKAFQEFQKISNREISHLTENYSEKNFQIKNQIMISVTFFKEKPEALSTVFRHSSWPKNTVRVLNRYYRIPERRDIIFSKKLSRGLVLMLDDQTKKSFHEGYNCVFFSRLSAYSNSMQFMVQTFNKGSSQFQWTFSPKTLYLVCPYPEAPRCWQLCSFCSFNNQPLKILNRQIT